MHIANYKQNQDFEKHTQFITHNSKNILKINTKDTLTYFRLEHEISEAKRKQDEFNILRDNHINRLMGHDLVDYDKKIMEENNQFEMQERIKKTKSYNQGLELGKLLKPGLNIDHEHEMIGQSIRKKLTMKTSSSYSKGTQKLMKLKPIYNK